MKPDACRLAAAVRTGETTAQAIARSTLLAVKAYDAVQPAVWISRFSDEDLMAQAEQIDARLAKGEALVLAGVPFAVKDNIDVAGLETTAACPDFAYRPQANAYVVQRLLDAGALCVGKTNLDQFATGLNGTRSPYGAPACVFNRAFISGGSSSGSAVAVAAGLVAFALGTDTAGSGRVPAAFNHLIGLKPSRGRWSSRGLVPACRTLDCISLFSHTTDDALYIDAVIAGYDAHDPYSRRLDDSPRPFRRIGVAQPDQLSWCGDAQSPGLYAEGLERLRRAGATLVEIDITALNEAAALLYNGPWLAERTAALVDFLTQHPDAFDPVVREIIGKGFGISACDAFKAMYRLAELRRQTDAMWEKIDMLVLPTTPTIYRIDDMRADPVALNSKLGLYTNFVNLLDMAALAVPAGLRDDHTGFGLTFIGPAGTDRALLLAAQAYMAAGPHLPAPALDLRP
ncbi:allophanate hydrolase [Asticcacaulis sp. EMRT-3]|uniref:allophanate hydrolase n=1 Tax=Asticcacaulis sp. EMRT-3 TaxID=3040349 RepID=UPI0024AF8568|nr:allophanate hydrolase [Asticcacaulis sp. EMRT-3]MDI7773887.1 allophanate hydrolase [Asticcacaulis sp. EMRT-3]